MSIQNGRSKSITRGHGHSQHSMLTIRTTTNANWPAKFEKKKFNIIICLCCTYNFPRWAKCLAVSCCAIAMQTQYHTAPALTINAQIFALHSANGLIKEKKNIYCARDDALSFSLGIRANSLLISRYVNDRGEIRKNTNPCSARRHECRRWGDVLAFNQRKFENENNGHVSSTAALSNWAGSLGLVLGIYI